MIRDGRVKRYKYQIIISVLVIMIMGIVVFFTNTSVVNVENNACAYVRQNAENISSRVDDYFRSSKRNIQLISNLISYSLEDINAENVYEILNYQKEQSPFMFVEYIDKNGLNNSPMGAPFDASDREYYTNGMKGITGLWVNYSPVYSKEYLLNFYTPIIKDREIAGVLTGVLGAGTNISEILDTTFYEEPVWGILCDEEGRIVSTNYEYNDASTVQSLLRDISVSEDSIEDFLNHIQEGDTQPFHFYEKKGKSIACVFKSKETDWSIIQIVPAKSFKTISLRTTMGAIICILMIVVILLLYALYLKKDGDKRHRFDLVEKNKAIKNYEQIMLITATDTYKGIRRLDLESERFIYLYFENGKVKQQNYENWNGWLEKQRENIHPEDYEEMQSFLKTEHLRMLPENTTYRLDYRSRIKNDEGFYRHYSTSVSVSRVDGRKTVLMTTIDNTSSLLGELKQKKLLLAAAGIYLSMYFLDLKEDRMEVLTTRDYIDEIISGRTNHIQDIVWQTMSILADEQYLESVMEFIELESLNERMKDTNTISLEFLGKHSGWCRARFIVVDRDKENIIRQVLWVLENIDAEKRKENRLLYLSETDLMTGIRNRGSGERKIKELLSTDHYGMFCVMDVDKFKFINDNFGHDIGDKVLIAVANCMKNSFRDTDVVLRLGGDEFAAFAKNLLSRKEAEQVIDRLIHNINQISIPEMKGRRITISVGVAFRTMENQWDFEEMYRNADACTYESKKSSESICNYYEG